MKRVVVIGLGHVGKLTAELLASRMDVQGYDRADGPAPHGLFDGCDYAVVCVDTPRGDHGRADLSNLSVALEKVPRRCPVVIRSTVPPGTCRALSAEFGSPISHWPEYVGESIFAAAPWSEWNSRSPFAIVGDDEGDEWADLVAWVLGPQARVHLVTTVEAELIKYMENSFFAMKVSFVNEYRDICSVVDASWHHVREGWLADPRIERDHSDAFRLERGFDGRCLPKDLDALLAWAEEMGVATPILSAVRISNSNRTRGMS